VFGARANGTTTRLAGQRQGTAALSQSHQHGQPWLEGEAADAYDLRTWKYKLNTEVVEGRPIMVIPAMAIQRAMAEGARFSKKQMEGYGKSTWAKRFEAGVSVLAPIVVEHTCYCQQPTSGEPVFYPIEPEVVPCVVISANADGVRGSGRRVPRRLPQIPPGWRACFDVLILDPMITAPIFSEMLDYTGMFTGLGQFRPQQGGCNGRFATVSIDWTDARQSVLKRTA
jgi:hypothetical protein